MTIDYQVLREAAEKATQGEWVAFISSDTGTYAVHTPGDKRCEDVIKWTGFDGQKNAENNARYIAAIPPKVALALLGEIKRLEDKNIDAMCQIAELESNRAALAAEHGIQIAINELLALAPRLDKRAVDALSVAVEHLCKLIKKEAVSEQN
ncbi:TPA: ead/Ea22-like family protein [Escherichia coli]|nr:ead/Ea22-like family protein [Escherichia coli]HAL9585225.1 ead/Ea22-like family protein [Escherichia coli]HAL9710268.1 ead/Ea22-like family protein [Escherichia coli]HBL0862552.1 ead/Ea22-like family protein [Escherichia coli]HBL0973208.1 ead/Ea22-like family protein [Escherichia coli]